MQAIENRVGKFRDSVRTTEYIVMEHERTFDRTQCEIVEKELKMFRAYLASERRRLARAQAVLTAYIKTQGLE